MSQLFAPLALRPGVVARNRLWVAPMTNQQSHADGTLGDDELRFLAMRADGGFGVVETCAAHVAQDGKAWAGELGVHDDLTVPGLGRLATRLHEGGALAVAQLFHGGLRAEPRVSGLPAWSASPHQDPHADGGTEAQLEGVVRAFADAAARVARAGFDGVELHGAHGYLLGQFLSATQNRRTDRWGGELANRARLLRRVLAEVRRAAPGLVVGVRLSPESRGQAVGLALADTLEVAGWLAEDGVDFLHLSLWEADRPTSARPNRHPTSLFRERVGAVPLVVAGGLWTREDAETQLDLGADAVAVGRAAIGNPDWPLRLARRAAVDLPPYAPEVLVARGVSPPFVTYLRRWRTPDGRSFVG